MTARIKSVPRESHETKRFEFRRTNGRWKTVMIVAIFKDGHVELSDQFSENFIYLYPAQVKQLRDVLAGRVKWNSSVMKEPT